MSYPYPRKVRSDTLDEDDSVERKSIALRLTGPNLAALDELAEAHGMKRSKFIRKLIDKAVAEAIADEQEALSA